jgi:aspartyl-tRNA(Asn)/glutamyl-tRNA(Gln) amidotransferase subunit B
VEYEVKRQTELLQNGGRVIQETRRWDDEKGITITMRTKEVEQEYRYFPDPDLIPMDFSAQLIEEQRSLLPELPEARRERFVAEFGLPSADAELLTSTKAMADYYEEAAKVCEDYKGVSNWIMGDFTRMLNSAGIEIQDSKVKPADLAELLKMVADDVISGKMAKTVFDEMFETGKSPKEIVKSKGMVQVSSEAELYPIIDQVISENPRIVQDFLGGKEKSFGFLVGQVMRYTQGRGNPQAVNEFLRKRLSEMKQES